MGRRGFMLLAGLLGLFAGIALFFHFATAPTVLRLAVGPLASEDMRMAAGFVQGINRAKGGIRLKLVAADGVADAAARLAAGEAELAILRPDIAMPPNAETVLITRRFLLFFVARGASGIERIADMAGRRVGVVAAPQNNVALLRLILDYYGLAPEAVEIVPLAGGDVAAAAASGRIDAMFAVGALTSRTVSPTMNLVRDAWKDAPVFIPVREAEAIAVRNSAIEQGEIVRGAFGGNPPQPAEELPTIAVTHRLVAAQDVSDTAVAEVTRQVLTLRAVLSAEIPSMLGIEAPSTARDAALRVHAGAAAYLDGEEETFFDRYGDWFYIGVMGLSLVGSGFAAMLSQASTARRRNAMQGLARIVTLISDARMAAGEATLREIEIEADDILAGTLRRLARNEIDGQGLSAYRLAMDQLGRAVAERRRGLELDEPLPLTG